MLIKPASLKHGVLKSMAVCQFVCSSSGNVVLRSPLEGSSNQIPRTIPKRPYSLSGRRGHCGSIVLEELDITGLILTNYHRLKNLKKAVFLRCKLLDQDISCFGNIESLTLNLVCTTMDISSLNELPVLKLDNCTNLSGWSSLGENRELFARGCGFLDDISHLRNVEKLSLHYLRGNISPLQNVIVLDLSYSYITDVSCLADSAVRDLRVYG
jgi:hypothetical protein